MGTGRMGMVMGRRALSRLSFWLGRGLALLFSVTEKETRGGRAAELASNLIRAMPARGTGV